MLTVALARLRLSGSLTAALEMTDALEGRVCSSVQVALAELIDKVGGSLTPTTLSAAVTAALDSAPSLTVQLRMRLVSDPKSVGFSPPLKRTDCSTVS